MITRNEASIQVLKKRLAALQANNASNASRTPYASIDVKGKTLIFATPNATTRWRVDTFFSKEPETLRWLNSFSSEDTLIDVGANVGMYSIYAAAVCGVHVWAFEPEAQNFALLNENIYLNQVASLIKALPIAISNEVGVDQLNLSVVEAGGSCHATGPAIGFNGKPFNPAFVQSTYKCTLDSFARNFYKLGRAHLKIDVDGIEPLVIAGTKSLMEEKYFDSVLIEINHNLEEHLEIVRQMLDWGFVFNPAQVRGSLRTSGPFSGVANYVFTR